MLSSGKGSDISLWKAANNLVNSLNCLGLSMGTALANNSIRYNSFLVLEVSLDGKKSLVRTLSLSGI